MGPKTSNAIGWFTYVVLGVWVISGILVTFLELQIDSIVHGQLYNYGLQFSIDWANPYWTFAKTIYASIALPIVLSVVAFGLKLASSRKKRTDSLAELRETSMEKKTAFAQPKLQVGTMVEEDELMSVNFDSEPDHSKEVKEKLKMQASSELLISCPNCRKVFNRPLVMLDFAGGKTRLVNICPYCNHNLGDAVEQRKPGSDAGLESRY